MVSKLFCELTGNPLIGTGDPAFTLVVGHGQKWLNVDYFCFINEVR